MEKGVRCFMVIKYLIILSIIFLLLAPVSAKTLTTPVTDKEIVDTYGISYTIHTKDFGDINVVCGDYEKILIGDNITFNTKSTFGLWHIEKINGKDFKNYVL